jgi:hypothetical protein
MNYRNFPIWIITIGLFFNFAAAAQVHKAQNPVIHADVPDMSMIRVGDTYYMSSTTMHMSPGVPIMKSTDLVNWKIINYAYDTLANVDAMNLVNGKSTYGKGTWASASIIRRELSMFPPLPKQPTKPISSKPKILKKAPGNASPLRLLIMIIPFFSTTMGAST